MVIFAPFPGIVLMESNASQHTTYAWDSRRAHPKYARISYARKGFLVPFSILACSPILGDNNLPRLFLIVDKNEAGSTFSAVCSSLRRPPSAGSDRPISSDTENPQLGRFKRLGISSAG